MVEDAGCGMRAHLQLSSEGAQVKKSGILDFDATRRVAVSCSGRGEANGGCVVRCGWWVGAQERVQVGGAKGAGTRVNSCSQPARVEHAQLG